MDTNYSVLTQYFIVIFKDYLFRYKTIVITSSGLLLQNLKNQGEMFLSERSLNKKHFILILKIFRDISNKNILP
jgi:hypothetical protein